MRSLPYLAVAACAALLAWHAHGWLTPTPDPVVRTDTLRVEADAPDPEDGTEPDTRIVYRTRTDTVQQACLSLPQTYDTRRMSLVQPQPITIEGRTVTLTRYETDTQRYVQDVFRTRRPRWAATLHAYASADPYAQEAGVGVSGRYRGVTLTPTVGVRQTDVARLVPGIRLTFNFSRWTHE